MGLVTTIHGFNQLFDRVIKDKKVIGTYSTIKINNRFYMFGIEVEGGYKYVIGEGNDPQVSYILSPKNKVLGKYDNWNK